MSKVLSDYWLYAKPYAKLYKDKAELEKSFFSRSSDSSGRDNHVKKQLSLSVIGLKAGGGLWSKRALGSNADVAVYALAVWLCDQGHLTLQFLLKLWMGNDTASTPTTIIAPATIITTSARDLLLPPPPLLSLLLLLLLLPQK